mmetsp:Transcript_16081/g.45487  ORF Transcript_16081/g.45487 Transcript_16081/m.45487 type:complete len:337 (+) Transcript_16081:1155-2165(+)
MGAQEAWKHGHGFALRGQKMPSTLEKAGMVMTLVRGGRLCMHDIRSDSWRQSDRTLQDQWLCVLEHFARSYRSAAHAQATPNEGEQASRAQPEYSAMRRHTAQAREGQVESEENITRRYALRQAPLLRQLCEAAARATDGSGHEPPLDKQGSSKAPKKNTRRQHATSRAQRSSRRLLLLGTVVAGRIGCGVALRRSSRLTLALGRLRLVFRRLLGLGLFRLGTQAHRQLVVKADDSLDDRRFFLGKALEELDVAETGPDGLLVDPAVITVVLDVSPGGLHERVALSDRRPAHTPVAKPRGGLGEVAADLRLEAQPNAKTGVGGPDGSVLAGDVGQW